MSELDQATAPTNRILYLKDKDMSIEVPEGMTGQELNKTVLNSVYKDEVQPKIPWMGRSGFVQSMTANALAGATAPLRMFGLNKPLEKQAEGIRQAYKADNPYAQFANDFANSMGGMFSTLPYFEAMGAATMAKAGFEFAVTPTMKALRNIPAFAVGMGEEAAGRKVVEGKPLEAPMAGLESTAIGTLFGSVGVGKDVPSWMMSNVKMASIGWAESHYEALKKGRLATFDEQAKGAADALAMNQVFHILPALKAAEVATRGETLDSKAIDLLEKAIKAASDQGDLGVARRAIQQVTGEVPPEPERLRGGTPKIVSAAVKVGDKIFDGASHEDALNKAGLSKEIAKEGVDFEARFRTNKDELITRDQAQEQFGISRSEDMDKQAYRGEPSGEDVPGETLQQKKEKFEKRIQAARNAIKGPKTYREEVRSRGYLNEQDLIANGLDVKALKESGLGSIIRKDGKVKIDSDAADILGEEYAEGEPSESVVQDLIDRLKSDTDLPIVAENADQEAEYGLSEVEKEIIREEANKALDISENPSDGLSELVSDVMNASRDEHGVKNEDAEKEVPKIKSKLEKYLSDAKQKLAEHFASRPFVKTIEGWATSLRTANKAIDLSTYQLYKSVDYSKSDMEQLNRYVDHLEVYGKEPEHIQLTPEQRAFYDQVLKPLDAKRKEMYREANKDYPMEDGVHNRRYIAGRRSILDRLAKGSFTGIGGGLRQTTGSMKARVYKCITDKAGNRRVVAIKGNEVTAIVNGEGVHLGMLKRDLPDPVREFFDEKVTKSLNELMDNLGIKHERVIKAKGFYHGYAGVSFGGQGRIMTRVAAPEATTLHEIGHQLDERYSLQDVFVDIKQQKGMTKIQREQVRMQKEELRALADLRYEGSEPTKGYKSYVRKGEEKIAVMFESLLASPENFREVAPTVYDKFTKFLESKPELKPILDIKRSLVMGEGTVGEVQNGGEFKDKYGNKYRVGDATEEEIEAATGEHYYKDIFLKTLVDHAEIQKAVNAIHFMEKIKEHPDFEKVAAKYGDPNIPEGWQTTKLRQFSGYVFEPRVADALDYLNMRMYGGDRLKVLSAINGFLRAAIFFNPLIHTPNIAVHWEVNRGAMKWIMPKEYATLWKTGARAMDAVTHLNDDYVQMLESGVNLLYSEQAGNTIQDLMKAKMAAEFREGLPQGKRLAMDLGMAIPKAIEKIYDFSGNVTWWTNDVAIMQAIYEEMDGGKTQEEAIDAVGKHIPNYVVPSRILDNRALGALMTNQNITMFGAYHYGALKSYGEMAKSMVTGTNKEKQEAIDKVAMLAITSFVIYPMLDKIAQNITGNKATRLGRAGAATFPDVVARLKKGRMTYDQAIQSVVTPSVGLKQAVEFTFNINTFNKARMDEGKSFTEMMTDLAMTSISPVDVAQRLSEGKTDLETQLLSMARIKVGTQAEIPTKDAGSQTIDMSKEAVGQLYRLAADKAEAQRMNDVLFSKDPDKAMAERAKFNERQLDQLLDLLKSSGFKGTPSGQFLNKYMVRQTGQSQESLKKEIEDRKNVKKLGKRKTYRRKVVDPETAQKIEDVFRGEE